MTDFKNVKATVIYSNYHGQGIIKNHFKLEDGTVLAWDSKSAPIMVKGEEVNLTARFKKMDWRTGNTEVSNVRIAK